MGAALKACGALVAYWLFIYEPIPLFRDKFNSMFLIFLKSDLDEKKSFLK